MSLDSCIKKMGKALNAKDADSIRGLVAGGMSDIDAVESHLQSMRDQPLVLNQSPVDIGGFKTKTFADGTMIVHGDVVAIRKKLPKGVLGKPVPGGLRFTPTMSHRAAAGLRGESVTYSRGGKILRIGKDKNGHYLGASESNNTDARRRVWRKKFKQLALEGEPGRFWYEFSGSEILVMAGNDVVEAKKFIALLAIYSPQAKVDSNTTFALRAWAQYKAGVPIEVKTGSQDRQATEILNNIAQWDGEKTNNFYSNLLREVDANYKGKQGATIDMWMMRAGFYDHDAPTPAEYLFMENETNILAKELDWEPQQVQAAVWVAMKARMEDKGVKKETERTSKQKKWIKYVAGKRVILDDAKHSMNWVKHAMKYDPTEKDTNAAKFDFSDGVRVHIGQLSWEGITSVHADFIPGIHNATYEQLLELQEALQIALSDESGIDLIAQYLGILADGSVIVPGAWEDNINPSSQVQISMAPAAAGVMWIDGEKEINDRAYKALKAEEQEKWFAVGPRVPRTAKEKTDLGPQPVDMEFQRYGDVARIDPAQHKVLELHAAMLGLLLRQDGVGYHKPFFKTSLKDGNAVDLRMGEPLTPEQMKKFSDDVNSVYPGIVIVSTPDGVRVVKFDETVNNRVFHKTIKKIADGNGFDGEIVVFASDGALIENNWKENPNGEGYVNTISGQGRPDFLKWGADFLYPKVQAVYEEFDKRYGWSGEQGITTLFQGSTLQLDQSAFHGSPYLFDKFSLDEIGSGEGAQIYGWGLYFAGRKEIAKWYREKLKGEITITFDGEVFDPQSFPEMDNSVVRLAITSGRLHGTENAIETLKIFGENDDTLTDEHREFVANFPYEKFDVIQAGGLYEVDIPDDSELFDFNKPVHEQSEKIRGILAALPGGDNWNDRSGKPLFATDLQELIEKRITGLANRKELKSLGVKRNVKGGTAQIAAEFWSKKGVPGLLYLDNTSRGNDENNTHNYVIWDESKITVQAVNDQLRQAMQQNENRASIELRENGERLIRLGKASDPSSFLHESAHLFLEVEKQLAREFGNQPHHDALFEWLGVSDWNDITVDMHEKYAETFEVYLETGKAPSMGLKDAFAAFRRWLTRVYKSLDPRVRADLTPEIIEYFDRLLATDAEIELAQADPLFEQLFRSQEQAGMTDVQWEKYQQQKLRVTDKATSTLDEQLIKELKRRKTQAWNDEKEPIIEEERERLSKEPTYSILSDAADAPMDHATVAELNGGKIPGNMIGKTRKEDGVDPDEYAEVYGFPSAKAMIKAISETPALRKAARDAAEEVMINRHGDILNDGSIEQEAREAMHNDEQGKLLLIELRALDKKSPINLAYLKAEAKRMIGQMHYKDIKPNKYYRAEIRAAIKAKTAKTDEERLEAKGQQAANHYLYREAVNAREGMTRQRKYVRDVQGRKYSTKTVNERFVQNMKTIANMYDLRDKPERVRTVNEVLDWYQAQLTDPNKLVDIALLDYNLLRALEERVLTGAVADNFDMPTFDDLTVDEMQGLYDQLRHLRYVGGQMADEAKAEIAADRLRFQESIIENGGNDVKDPRGLPTVTTKLKRKLSHLVNLIPSLRNLTRKLDGMSNDGEAYRLIYSQVEQGNNRFIGLQTEFYDRFNEELDDIHKIGLQNRAKDKKVYELTNGTSIAMHPENRFMLALYWGTESSREAIRQGWGITDADALRIMQDLTVEQLNMVNTTWKVNETVWPDLSAASVLAYGVAPPKLEATPFEINGVEMTGGHQRLFYDSTELELLDEKEKSMSQSDIMPTKAGSLHSRVGSGGRPPLLDRTNITRALDDSLRFIAFAEPGRRLRSIINSDDVKGAIERKHGVGFYAALVEDIDFITSGRTPREAVPGIAMMMSHLRKAATFRHLAYSIRNVVQQGTSIPIAMQEVGFARWSNAAIRMANPRGRTELRDMIKAKSTFMANRTSLINREVSEHMRQMTVNTRGGKVWNDVSSHVFILQTMVDGEVAFPTWLASYERAIEEHGDEGKAISAADTSVAESVGAGSALHLGGAFHGSRGEIAKTFTMFGSWFNAYYQRIYRASAGGDFSQADKADLFNTVFTMPMIVGVMSAALIADGPGDDPEAEDWALWATKQWGLFLTGTVPVIRDIAGSFRGYAPSTVWSSGGEVPYRAVSEAISFIQGNQSSVKYLSDMIKLTSTVVPLPGAGNITRVLDYTDSYNKGQEGDFYNMYQALVEGADKN